MYHPTLTRKVPENRILKIKSNDYLRYVQLPMKKSEWIFSFYEWQELENICNGK